MILFTLMFSVFQFFGPIEKIYAIIFSISTILISWFTASTSSKGRISIAIQKKEVHINYLSKPIFSRKKNLVITLNDIKSWRFRSDNNFEMFKISTLTGNKIRFERNSSWTKDSDTFHNFLRKFKSLIEDENRKRKERDEAQIIDKEAEFYSGNFSKFMFYFTILAIISAGVIIILSWDSGESTPFYLLTAAVSGLFYIMRYKQMRKK